MKSPNRGFLTKSAYSSTELVKFHRCEGSNPSSPTKAVGDLCAGETAPRSPSLYLPGGRPPGTPGVGCPDGGRGFPRGRRAASPEPPCRLRRQEARGSRTPGGGCAGGLHAVGSSWSPGRQPSHPEYLFMLCVPAGSCFFMLCVPAGGVPRVAAGCWGGRRSPRTCCGSFEFSAASSGERNGGALRPVAASSCPAARAA